MSLSIDFYVRVFVRVRVSANEVKASATKQMYIYQSQGCESFYIQRVGRKVHSTEHERATSVLPPEWIHVHVRDGLSGFTYMLGMN
jgi:tRNA (guanine26-N2/guanine27-N2)-dimethyltransferase